MASVRQRDTGPELRLRSSLHRLGLRYRLNDRKLPGSPDLVMPRFNTVVFVHGCFWHVHKGCRFATKPSSRKDFWRDKFAANQKRDKRNNDVLRKSGWRVFVVWECAIKGRSDEELKKLGIYVAQWLKSKSLYGEVDGKMAQYLHKSEKK